MNINIKSRNLEVTTAIREYLEKKLTKLEKLIDADEALVTLSVTKERRRVEVTIPLKNGIILRGAEEGYDMYASIDSVAEKLESQIRRYKTRLSRKGHGTARGAEFNAMVNQPPAEEEESELPVKVKRFPVKPIPVEEAIMQMNLLGHNFFVFQNADTGNVNVVYRRNDGDFGLLEPEA